MGRAAGKHTGRKPTIEPGTPEGDYVGLSARQRGQAAPRIAGEGSPIPGGRQHLGNTATVPQEVPTTEPRDTYSGMMAHGVPAEYHDAHERSDAERGPNDHRPPKPHHAGTRGKRPDPVPVYIVTERGGPRPKKIAVPRHITVGGFNTDPVCIAGVDFNRTAIRVMNNDATSNIRISSDPTSLLQDPGTSGATLRSIGGALLPKGMTSYQTIETQDELWAIVQHATNTAELNIIMESSVPGAG